MFTAVVISTYLFILLTNYIKKESMTQKSKTCMRYSFDGGVKQIDERFFAASDDTSKTTSILLDSNKAQV